MKYIDLVPVTLTTSGFKAGGGARHPLGLGQGWLAMRGPRAVAGTGHLAVPRPGDQAVSERALGKKETLTLNPGSKQTFAGQFGEGEKDRWHHMSKDTEAERSGGT